MTGTADEPQGQRPPCGDTGILCPYTPWCGQPGSSYHEPCAVEKKLKSVGMKRKATPETDAVNPAHYQHASIEVIDFIREQLDSVAGAAFSAYCHGNAIKYLGRAGKKGNAAEDFAKAAWYAQMAAHSLEPTKYDDPRGKRGT